MTLRLQLRNELKSEILQQFVDQSHKGKDYRVFCSHSIFPYSDLEDGSCGNYSRSRFDSSCWHICFKLKTRLQIVQSTLARRLELKPRKLILDASRLFSLIGIAWLQVRYRISYTIATIMHFQGVAVK